MRIFFVVHNDLFAICLNIDSINVSSEAILTKNRLSKKGHSYG